MGLISTIAGTIIDANKMAKQKKAQNDDTTQHVIVNDKYSIDLPSFLSPVQHSEEEVSLLYGNRTLDISIAIKDESKSEMIETIKDFEEISPDLFDNDDSFLEKVYLCEIGTTFDADKIEIMDYTETTINGLKAATAQIFQERTFFKDAVYSHYTFIEGKESIYTLVINIGGTSIRKLAEKLEASTLTFKEL